ncbi:alpha/beta hydrolase [Marinicella litoralis]|uniref:Proline iminopeptidase n=1 Tax=Marinicella litoralis TaxID=644220 RepID=A0A4R6XZW4_9GAMM|nr:alpha/beta hydrolase [Marinicella litoralis]TDR23894.1 alpha/beta hydrolase family protein [Marinicella litoralis]
MKKLLITWVTWLTVANVQALELEPCFIGAIGSGVSTAAECGQLTVPENRQNPDKTIDLNLAVIRSTSNEKLNDPLLLLAGGPGQGAVDTFAGIVKIFDAMLPLRDIVLVDQRGTGKSNPLRCEIDPDEYEALSDMDSDAWKDWTKKCHQGLDADTRYYTTTEAINDLEAVREALEIEQWNLYGGSYGTRKALTYMKMFPDSIRSVILDASVPQEQALGVEHETNLRNTLQQIFALCEADEACQTAFGDAEQQLWKFLDQLKEAPINLRIQNSSTGTFEDVLMTREYAVIAMRMFAYSPETMGLIPLMVSLANHGQPETMAAQAQMVMNSLNEGLNNALEISVSCAEDVPFMPKTSNTTNSLFGDELFELMHARCELWDSIAVDPSFKEPVVSDIPTLLLSGEYDPVTPPKNAEQIMQTLSNAQHLVAKGQGHIVGTRGCMPKIVTAFIKDPSKELETECMNDFRDFSFFINMNGPKE